MRYNRMRDLGLSEDADQEEPRLPGPPRWATRCASSLDPKQAKDWFGARAARPLGHRPLARRVSQGTGADYLYTYLRSYYRDDTKATGWNNLAFPSVAMPHVLWELQGQRAAKFVEQKDPHDHAKTTHVFAGYEQLTPGQPVAAGVRRRRRRPRRLHAVDGRAGAGPARAPRRVGAAVPVGLHPHHLASQRGLLEIGQVVADGPVPGCRRALGPRHPAQRRRPPGRPAAFRFPQAGSIRRPPSLRNPRP